MIPHGILDTDRVVPTLAMTSPAQGATLAGVITVSATASDNDKIASVQFLLDGGNLGAAQTTPPFQLSQDTMAIGNGAHSFGARATDRLGNQSTVTVGTTVANQPTTPPNTQGPQNVGFSTAIDQGWGAQGSYSNNFSYGIWVSYGRTLQYRYHIVYDADQKPPISQAFFSDGSTETGGAQWNTGLAGDHYDLWSGWYNVPKGAGSANVQTVIRIANEPGGNPQPTYVYNSEVQYQWV